MSDRNSTMTSHIYELLFDGKIFFSQTYSIYQHYLNLQKTLLIILLQKESYFIV